MHRTFVIWIEAMGKPRMTRQDKWKKRDCVVRFRSYADEIRMKVGAVPAGITYVGWTAYLSMPDSWPEKKKAQFAGKDHHSKPDRDNIDKGILDALFESDQSIATGFIAKRWDDGQGARIELVLGDTWCVPNVLGETCKNYPAPGRPLLPVPARKSKAARR